MQNLDPSALEEQIARIEAHLAWLKSLRADASPPDDGAGGGVKTRSTKPQTEQTTASTPTTPKAKAGEPAKPLTAPPAQQTASPEAHAKAVSQSPTGVGAANRKDGNPELPSMESLASGSDSQTTIRQAKIGCWSAVIIGIVIVLGLLFGAPYCVNREDDNQSNANTNVILY
jgi:uncharacterized membrane protein